MLSWEPDLFSADSRGRMRYTGAASTLTGIDVSEHQYDIDWRKVAADGVDFAMIRVGYRGSTAGGIYTDDYFEKNIRGALNAGLKVGVYFFSQALDAGEAAEEAAFVLEQIRPYEITMPVVFDWEIVGGSDARTYTVDRRTLCEAVRAGTRATSPCFISPGIWATASIFCATWPITASGTRSMRTGRGSPLISTCGSIPKPERSTVSTATWI